MKLHCLVTTLFLVKLAGEVDSFNAHCSAFIAVVTRQI